VGPSALLEGPAAEMRDLKAKYRAAMAARRGSTGRDPTGTTAEQSGRVAANTNSISDVGKALTNIVSGSSEHVKACVKAGIVPKMTQLLDSPNDDLREQAVWALGNIATDSVKMRDEVLNHNVLLPLLHLLDPNTTRISMLRHAIRTLSKLCRGKPQPPFDLVKPALPTLALLIHSNDEEVLTDACWALSYLSDGSNDKIQAVIDAGVCPRLVELLMHQSAEVQTPALRTVSNMVAGDDQQTQHVIDCAVLPCLHQLLSNARKGIRKEAYWALSNITSGSKLQLQAVIDHNIIPSLVHMLETEDFDIRQECAWAISNATSVGDDVQIKFLVDAGCVPPLVNLLDKPNVHIVSLALQGIENILKCGQRNQQVDGTNPFVAAVKMCGGVDKIENLQRHEKHKINDTAVMILKNYIEASVSFPRSCCRLCPLPCAPLCAEAARACSWAETACACALSHLAVAAGCALPANEQ
jgi:importin subunit alpha-6/7